MSDGVEEREEQKARIEQERREDGGDQLDREVDEWEPERRES
jgi:hypothetical protein